jgi:putative NADH-flavin reductase
MNILVIGTRGIGREVIKQALEMGHTVRALSRHPENIKITDPKLTIITGDAAKPEDINKAAVSMDVIVSAIGTPPSNKKITLFTSAARSIISAVKNNGVKLLISVTGIGAGDSNGHGGFIYDRIIFPLLLKKVYEDKNSQELLIKQSDINWIIVRPGLLTNSQLTQKYRVLTDLKGVKSGSISRADCAHFILTQAASRTFIKQTPLITY